MSGFENLTKEQVARKVRQWILEEGLTVNEYKDEKADFAFATGQGYRQVYIGFHKSSVDSLIVLGRFRFESQEQSAFRYTKTKREMLYDLEILFVQMNLDFILSVNTEQEEFTIEAIVLQKTIYFDGLSKDKLFDVMSSIFNCLKVLQSKFELLGRQRE